MHPGIIRLGGSTIEGYVWQQGIGPWDNRQPFTTIWGGMDENFVGIDEFIQLCQHVGAEPLICVRWKLKKPEDTAAEVKYCNGSLQTRWGKLRAQNGHHQPYGVKYRRRMRTNNAMQGEEGQSARFHIKSHDRRAHCPGSADNGRYARHLYKCRVNRIRLPSGSRNSLGEEEVSKAM